MSNLENCPVCGSCLVNLYAIGATNSSNNEVNFRFIVCRNCGHALLSPGIPFINKPLSEEELSAEWNRRANQTSEWMVNKWVSVKDRLPVEGNGIGGAIVLAAYRQDGVVDNHIVVKTLRFVKDDPNKPGIWESDYPVEYWQPRPQPPKEMKGVRYIT